MNCGDPGLPDNSDRQGDDFLFTDTVQYTCNNGYYQSSGDSNLTCLDTGLWNGTLPVCTGEQWIERKKKKKIDMLTLK